MQYHLMEETRREGASVAQPSARVGGVTLFRTARREVDQAPAATRFANERLALYASTLARACQEDSEISVGRAMNADEEMENTDPTENAAMAEDFGKTIKNALNGGKGPLLKLMKVRATFPRDGAPRESPAILFPQKPRPRANTDEV